MKSIGGQISIRWKPFGVELSGFQFIGAAAVPRPITFRREIYLEIANLGPGGDQVQTMGLLTPVRQWAYSHQSGSGPTHSSQAVGLIYPIR